MRKSANKCDSAEWTHLCELWWIQSHRPHVCMTEFAGDRPGRAVPQDLGITFRMFSLFLMAATLKRVMQSPLT